MKWMVALLLLPFAGCITEQGPVIRMGEDSCVLGMCILEEPEPYWLEYLQENELEQVPLTHDGRAGGFVVGRDFMAWSRGGNETVQSEFYALDFEQARIIPFGTRTVERTMGRIIHDRDVVFELEDMSLAGLDRFSMWVWNFDNETMWRLPISLEGGKHPDGYDGDWVVITNTLRTYRAVELWAYNIHDDRLLQLHQPQPKNKHENGTGETVRTPVLHEGIAYYTVGWLLESGEYWTDIFATELESNTTTRITRLPGVDVQHMDVGDDYLAYSTAEKGWVLDLDTGDVVPLPVHGNRATWIPTVHGEWVAYRSLDGRLQDLWLFNPQTGDDLLLIEGSEDFMPGSTWLYGGELYVYVQVVNPFDEGPHYSNRIFKMDAPFEA